MTQKYDLQEQIDRLESMEGDGTECITVTIPPDKSIDSIKERIAQEYAGAENIKSDKTRERVQQALDRIQRILRRYKKSPENGLVVYAGVVDGEMESHVFDDLPRPVGKSTYTCDDHFDTTPLADAVAPSETFGLIVVERGRAAIGRLVGDRVIALQSIESQVMGKSRAGGQSAKRFERERERQEHEFFVEVGALANEYLIDGGEAVTGVAIGGTLATAKKFVDNDYLDHRLRDRVLGTYAVEYATEQGLERLVSVAEEQLLDAEQREQREYLDEFYSRLRDDDRVTYGRERVETAIDYGAVDVLLVSSSVSGDRRESLSTAVDQQGGEAYIVSVDTDRGHQFSNTFGGIGALLRFSVE